MRRRNSLTIIAAVAVLLSLLPGRDAPVRAASTFTFHGSGYGHGLGLSQWGAYGLAQMGWSHQRIVTHFYTATKVERRDTLPPSIRIGLTSGRTLVHLTARGGPVRIWEGKPRPGALVGKIPMDQTWTVAAKTHDYAVRDDSGSLVGRRGSPKEHLRLTYADTGSRVFVREADEIWHRGFTYGRGTIEFNLTSCGDANGCSERMIAKVGLEEYLYGLGEVPASWPMETLEAQAVAARSYAVYSMRHTGLRGDCNCHLTDGSGDQVYVGYNRELEAQGGRWVNAVDATRRQVVVYGGSVIQAFYAASDGGHSEDVENVWHGGNDAYAIPWLRGVCDPGESTAANPWDDWTRSFDAATVSSRLAPYTGSIGTIGSFQGIRRGSSGRILTAIAKGSNGTATVTGTEIRAALGLPDDRVWINADRNVTGALRETYDALMCAPGLPVSPTTDLSGGAQQFFENGGLYRNGGAGITLWLRGQLDREYRAVGAGKGVLGLPVSSVRSFAKAVAGDALTCATCRRVDFARGRIFFKAGLGANALWGRVLEAYAREGGINGPLGFPQTRVRSMHGGGVRARFEAGRIACPKGEHCRVKYG